MWKQTMQRFLKTISSYKALFLLWLILGIVTLIIGDISRITYFYAWILLLIEFLFKALTEE